MPLKPRDIDMIKDILKKMVVARLSESTLDQLRDVVYLDDVLKVLQYLTIDEKDLKK